MYTFSSSQRRIAYVPVAKARGGAPTIADRIYIVYTVQLYCADPGSGGGLSRLTQTHPSPSGTRSVIDYIKYNTKSKTEPAPAARPYHFKAVARSVWDNHVPICCTHPRDYASPIFKNGMGYR